MQQVETFECTEVSSDGVAPDAATIALIESLGLTGQKSMINKEAGLVCPYRKMKADESFAYGVLCGTKTPLKDYCDEQIPLRVLQVAAHANTLDIFTRLEVWHTQNADVKDPVLVGVREKSPYSFEYFLLARWGEMLEPIATLLKMAADKQREVFLSEARAALAEAESDIRLIEKAAASDFIAGRAKKPSYSNAFRMY